MKSSDAAILSTAASWLKQEKEILLVTVAKTWGSSPRPVGSMMLIKPDGKFVGSVSGGCIEEDLVHKYLSNQLENKNISLLNYGVGQLDAQKFGLPCGGKLELVIEKLNSANSLAIVSETMKKDLPIARHLNVQTGSVSYSEPDWNQCSSFDGKNLHKIFGQQWQILLIGANELSKYVAEFAASLNYKIIICDPREHSNTGWIDEKMQFS